jgi:PKD repeat protein
VTIAATPIGTGFTAGTTSQTVDIHLVPLGVILPPADTPTANFVVTPQPVQANVPTNFDASLSCGGQLSSGQCTSANVIVSYQWGFGDGASASGRAVQHAYSAPGTYTVILTVTNNGGRSATTSQTVSVDTSEAPTAEFSFSPSSPAAGQQIQFNASGSRAAAGRTIVRYDWAFGDGETQTGVIVNKNYTVTGTFNVTLTVTDDVGQIGTTTRGVNVGTANPTAVLIILKTGALNIQGDGTASTAVGGATITNYAFNWGDGTTTTGAAAVVAHNYGLTLGAGTYTVRLTVTDSLARTGTVTQSVTVP